MSFPNIVYGKDGDEKVVSPSPIGGNPLGIEMRLPDGRIYRHAQASATALIAGKLYIGASFADTMMAGSMVVVGDGVVGGNTIKVTIGGTTAIVAGDFDDGYFYTASSVGVGETYKIKSTSTVAVGSSVSFTVTLVESDPIKTLIANGTTLVGLKANDYRNVRMRTTGLGTQSANIAGIPTTAVAASNYCWLARRGAINAFSSATVMAKGQAIAADTVVAGEMGPLFTAASAGTASWVTEQSLGYCLQPAGTAKYFSLVYLELE